MGTHELLDALERSPAVWGVVAQDTGTGASIIELNADRVLHTASVGKLILLACAGQAILREPETTDIRLDRRGTSPVKDSGLWQHLDSDGLSLADAARLVFATSDNLATNVLLRHFGLERVRAFRSELGFTHTDLLDLVRDARSPTDPETLSRGTAGELCAFMRRTARDAIITPALSGWLVEGLALNMDLSMVPAPLGLDPLAHPWHTEGVSVANKTGTDAGVRADAGIIRTGEREVAYAAIANYDPAISAGHEILPLMHEIGRAIVQPAAHDAAAGDNRRSIPVRS